MKSISRQEYEFAKSLLSPDGKMILINCALIAAVGVFSFVKSFDIQDLLLVLFFGVGLLTIYSRESNKIIISDMGFSVASKSLIQWDAVHQVSFTIDSYNNVGKQIIEIQLHDMEKNIIIQPMLFRQSQMLRKVFEEFVDKKGISKIVEDRGYS